MTTLYHYPNCSTCRKARHWLDDNGIAYEKQDLVADPIDIVTLLDLYERSGLQLKKFFNTSGNSYRDGGFKDLVPRMTEEQQLEALAADGKLVKRPIIDNGETVLVGFKLASYKSAFT